MERRRRLASRGSSPLQGPGPRRVGSAAMVHLLDYISGQPPTQSVSGPPASRAPPSVGLISLFFFSPVPRNVRSSRSKTPFSHRKKHYTIKDTLGV